MSSDIEHKSLHYILPYTSRVAYFLGKILAITVSHTLLILVLLSLAFVQTYFHFKEFFVADYLLLSFILLIYVMTYTGFVILCSAIFQKEHQALQFAGYTFFVFYVSTLFSKTQLVSPLWHGFQIMQNFIPSLGFFIAVILVTYGATLWIFERQVL